jgi:hypothetical protein
LVEHLPECIGDFTMVCAKQPSKRKRRNRAVPVLGAAGLSLSLASGASAATLGSAVDMRTGKAEVRHEITLRDEEVSDVSLGTFRVFDKEGVGTFRSRLRLAAGGGCGGCSIGCGGGVDFDTSAPASYASPPYRPIRPAHKHTHTSKKR